MEVNELNNKISIFIFLTLFVIFSINAIYANDLNMSDIASSYSEANIENKIHENDLNTLSANQPIMVVLFLKNPVKIKRNLQKRQPAYITPHIIV